MATLKRRLNQAIGECRSQASLTARRLVKSSDGRSSASATIGPSATGGRARATVAPLGSRHQRPTFSYSFELEQASYGDGQLGHSQDDYYRHVQSEFVAGDCGPLMGDGGSVDYCANWNRMATQMPAVSAVSEQDDSQDSRTILNTGGCDEDSSSASPYQRQYFMRSYMNASIKTRRSHRRSIRGSRRNQTPGRQLRQVRFQPVPQAIDISIYSSASDDLGECENRCSQPDEDDAETTQDSSILGLHDTSFVENTSNNNNNIKSTPKPIKVRTVMQQLTRLSRKSRIQLNGVKPKFSAKPFQHLPGHIKSSFGKIKLKTLNNLASQLQHSLSNHSHHQSHQFDQAPAEQQQHSNHQSKQTNAANTKLTLPIQRTFHLRHSAASAKHQITLSINNQKVISPADLEALHSAATAFGSSGGRQSSGSQLNQARQHYQETPNDDDGWGSDFDESQSTTGHEDNSLNSTGASSSYGAAGGYLLEIGKSSCDTRAICDVIQDQGCSGQFKRLQDSSYIDYSPERKESLEVRSVCQLDDTSTIVIHQQIEADAEQGEEPIKKSDEKLQLIRANLSQASIVRHSDSPQGTRTGETESVHEADSCPKEVIETMADARKISSPTGDSDTVDDAAEEEAELRSLEARQNFKLVRDKLKLILEQRLASYERDLKPPKPAATKSTGEPSSVNSVPKPPPLPQKPIGVALGICEFNHLKPERQQQQVSSAPMVNNVSHDRFDCQSNCSEASSLSSGGLDSNHSGSQDSGHSTQHSADDGRSSTTSRTVKLLHHKQQQQQQQQHIQSSGCSSVSPTSSVVLVGCTQSSSSLSAGPLSSTAATTRYPLDAATRMRLLEQQRQMSLKLKQKPRRRTAKRALNLECSSSEASTSSASPPSSTSSACNSSLDNQSISTNGDVSGEIGAAYQPRSGVNGGSTSVNSNHSQNQYNHHQHHDRLQRLNLNDEIRQFHLKRANKGQKCGFTKQLSMVCLRQLEHRDEHDAPSMGESVVNQKGTNNLDRQHHHQQTSGQQPHHKSRQQVLDRPTSLTGQVPKSALSLRELIKEVIDDCEKPGKLSTLTRNILTRSDSLSSQDESV